MANQRKKRNVENYIHSLTTLSLTIYWSIFIRVVAFSSQICEISRKSPQIPTYSSARSSKVNDFGANRKRILIFLLVIKVTLDIHA